MSETTVEVVHYGNGNYARYAPEVLRRVADFCRQYNSDAHIDTMVATIAAKLYEDPRTVGTLVMVGVQDGKVVGHLVAEIQTYYGGVYSMITQLAVDRDSKVLPEVMTAGLEVVDAWTRAKGGTKQRIWARTPAVARLFRKHNFVDQERVLMERELPPLPVEEQSDNEEN